MGSIREGLRSGDVQKDTYERLMCADCETQLGTRDDDGVGKQRVCPDCGREWSQVR